MAASTVILGGFVLASGADTASAQEVSARPANQSQPQADRPSRFDIDEFRVDGADALPQVDVEEAVYPFLGPNRNVKDIQSARAALEKTYHSKGFQTVSVAAAQEAPDNGVVVLKVTEGRIGRLRVKGSRYYDLETVKRKAPSVREGKLPNFNELTSDIVALNQQPDRRVTPALRAGVTPGTVDVDLNVEDKLPLHASIELNNRQSPNTTAKRLSATVRYDNLWQLGHSASFTYQVAPERKDDAEAFSGSYLARLPDNDFFSILTYGVKSKSDVATVGGINVVGPGEILGVRGILTLPMRQGFFHTLSFGADYKHFDQTVKLGEDGFSSPITYYPVSLSYAAGWQGEGAFTQLNIGLTHGTRGLGSDPDEFHVKRAHATPNFFYLRGDLSHTHELPGEFQLFGKVQGQIADQPLVSSEQFSAGGLDTVRGYLESETLGDNGVAGTIELRSPNIGAFLQSRLVDENGAPVKFTSFNDWRVFAFLDAASVSIIDPLIEQQSRFNLWSYGIGTRFRLFDYVNGAVVLGIPMISQAYTQAKDPRLHFRIWGEF